MSWSAVPPDTLLDVEAVVAHWRARGLVVHRPQALAPSPDLYQPQTAFPLYPLGGQLNSSLVVRWVGARGKGRVHLGVAPSAAGNKARCVSVRRLPEVYMQAVGLPDLAERARAAVDAHLASAALPSGGGAGEQPPTVVLDLPCTLFAVRSLR